MKGSRPPQKLNLKEPSSEVPDFYFKVEKPNFIGLFDIIVNTKLFKFKESQFNTFTFKYNPITNTIQAFVGTKTKVTLDYYILETNSKFILLESKKTGLQIKMYYETLTPATND